MKKKILLYMLCGTLSTSVFSVATMPLSQMVTYAHSGRTDSSGGHRDNKNKSGLGSYHYHCGGNPPHLHTGGICPYGNEYSNGNSSGASESKINQNTNAANETQPEQPQYGWKQNEYGWYYQTSENAYCQNCFADIGGGIYYFNYAGTMATGWQNIEGGWYYFGTDGAMALGWQYINFMWYYFDGNGCMVTGWQTIGDKQYYFYSDGHMATEVADIDGTYYYFNSDGSLNKNWESDDIEEYYESWFNDDDSY